MSRCADLNKYLSGFAGTSARLVVHRGATDSAEQIRAVILANGENLNRELVDQGYGQYREDLGGSEARPMHGAIGKLTGGLAEGLAFQGDSDTLNPMHYIPTPGHTKVWQERTPLAQYINNEVVGTRMRRWQRPIHDQVSSSFRTPNTSRARVGPKLKPCSPSLWISRQFSLCAEADAGLPGMHVQDLDVGWSLKSFLVC